MSARTPVFVTDINYDSYTDYWKLVQASGFETCRGDDVDANRNCTYIISPLNGNIEAMLKARPTERNCTFALWFLERPGKMSNQEFNNDIASKFSSHNLNEIWFSDRGMYGLARDIGGTKFVPMGSDEAIGTTESMLFQHDVVHMSYVWGRRSLIHEFGCNLGPNCWGDERHRTLLSSRFMVNIHQDDGLYSEPLRFALAAAYARPMISEMCIDPYPYENGRDFVMVPYDKLKITTKNALASDYNHWKQIGLNMWETATKKFRFKTNVENAL